MWRQSLSKIIKSGILEKTKTHIYGKHPLERSHSNAKSLSVWGKCGPAIGLWKGQGTALQKGRGSRSTQLPDIRRPESEEAFATGCPAPLSVTQSTPVIPNEVLFAPYCINYPRQVCGRLRLAQEGRCLFFGHSINSQQTWLELDVFHPFLLTPGKAIRPNFSAATGRRVATEGDRRRDGIQRRRCELPAPAPLSD